ncbi:MAG: methyl-accepting chemotaxis protein [Pseudanabaenaceae cyanobacterium SKYGB_i_bin29]|nr:methyl-accepting chemotaxis protein [Pseudanabaenaceae cyanobacterium SKYG29]MDW8421691.1 methyl-accepting chemotaxis protein [Pseudanabaenaceae cyanobacterium SKYGB_i_bin29]
MATVTKEQEEYKKAERAYIDGRYEEAVVLTAKLVAHNPNNAKYRLLHGHVNLALKNSEEAIKNYEAAIQVTQDHNILEHATWGINEAEKQKQGDYYQEDTPPTSGTGDEVVDPFAESETDFSFGYEQEGGEYLRGDATILISPGSVGTNKTFITQQEEFSFDAEQADEFFGDEFDDTGAFRTLQDEDITSGFAAIEGEEFDGEAHSGTVTAIGLVSTTTDTDIGIVQTKKVEETPLPDFVPEIAPVRPGGLDGMSMRQKMLVIPLVSLLLGGAASLIVGLSPWLRAQHTKPLATTGIGLGVSTLTSIVLGSLVARKVKRTADSLQMQMEAVIRGNQNVRALVLTTDELGLIATGFNRMMDVQAKLFNEIKLKVSELEQAKEDLQRQVIRLLDDVEGAARGDLTVRAEVTADVLGAVADSFNLTIQNLSEIVLQVREAARQVNKGAAENETFARSLSADALRQAEELAVTLQNVQMMTESIQRVAESAREAEQVAKLAYKTALRGNDAVQVTLAGIVNIRKTVEESTRKVKRLGEASQEISKIVGLISGVASRTNYLAINASLAAAKAGEAGKEFALIADEIRQLADRVARSSREIEQIVLQIQGETNNVQLVMDKGTEQVIDGMRRAEQATQALNDIITVSQQIDNLVRSITEDTIRQTETSRTVSSVMQRVELTAQETSQEARRVSESLQNLVVVARNLQESVERFRVDVDDKFNR